MPGPIFTLAGVLTLTALLALAAAPAAAAPTVLAIFAHADDETGPGPALTAQAKTGKVRIAYITDGRYGVREGYEVPEGETLVAVREEEARCAARVRGFEPPVFFGFTDMLAGGDNVGEQLARLRGAVARIAEEIERVNPDIVVTFGPGGYTGHPDHRLAGALVREAALSRDWGEMRLLEFALTTSQIETMGGRALSLIGEADGSLDIAVRFDDDVRATESEALGCYVSQFSEAQMQAIRAAADADTSNTRWFREIVLKRTAREGF